MKKLTIIAVVLLSSAAFISAQNGNTKKDLQVYLNKDSTHYLKSTLCLQTWIRYNDNNPGSTVFGKQEDRAFDIGIRRFRMQMFGQITDRVFVYTQFGINNFNSISSRKSGAFFHDLTGEYVVKKNMLNIGAGLTGWSGLSRYASPSVASFLMSDAPLFQQATNDVTDQFLRKFSVYAKGKIGKFDYRVAVSKPMPIVTMAGFTSADTTVTSKATFSPDPVKQQYQGYFQYQFFDQESNVTPYATGCYLGKKKVLTAGAGLIYQPEALRYKSTDTSSVMMKHDLLLLAADVFLDLPLNKEKQNAITAYAGYFNYDFGQKYYRNVGVFNVANGLKAGSNTASGFGDAFPMIGTGQIGYLQAGYLFRKDLLKSLGTLQPVASVYAASLEALKDPVTVYEGGINWLINNHNAKLNLNYQNRPVFIKSTSGDITQSERKGMIYMQYQVFF
ncbi:MAG: hypothetical protein Fur0041_17100 [Bacteroidia bacterium]